VRLHLSSRSTTMRRGGAATLAGAVRRSLVAPASPATGYARTLATDASASTSSAAFRWAVHRTRTAKGETSAAAAFAASAAVVALATAASTPALADAMRASGVPFDRAGAVMEFLTGMGASFPLVEVRPEDPGFASSDADAHGLGLFMRPPDARDNASNASSEKRGFFAGIMNALGFGNDDEATVLASVPFRLALTVAAAAQHPSLGSAFRSLLEDDLIDDRMAVMLLLIMERRRGESSPIVSYLRALPEAKQFRTPLFYDDAALEGLAGTNLHAAVLAQRKQLDDVLKKHIRPAGKRLMRAMRAEEKEERARKKGGRWFSFWKKKVSGSRITEEEFRWAYACFWSRALALPLGDDPTQPVVEAIVPGIDFANHSCTKPNARWRARRPSTRENFEKKKGEDCSELTIELACEPGSVPQPGEEVKISYGDAPNEELLFVHGFADRMNPHEKLVLRAPSSWNSREMKKTKKLDDVSSASHRLAVEIEAEANTARATLLKLLGLPPHVILPQTPPSTLNALPEDTKVTLAVWGATPTELDAWLRYELDARFGGGSKPNASPMDVASRKSAALRGIRVAVASQSGRLEAATAPYAEAERRVFGEGVLAARGAGSKRAMHSAVVAASSRRVDEVVAADPLAPSTARHAATYRAGVRRMTRAYEDAVAKWT